MDAPAPTHYEVLDVPIDASAEQIRSAWRRAARAHHPDAGGNPAIFRMAADAYRVLSDPEMRASYDIELDGSGVEPPPGPDPPWGGGPDAYADGQPGGDAPPPPGPEPEYAPPPPPPPSYLSHVPDKLPVDIDSETRSLWVWGAFALALGLRLARHIYFGPHPPVWYHAALIGPVGNFLGRAFLFLLITAVITLAGLFVGVTAYRTPAKFQLALAAAAWLAAFHPLWWAGVFASAAVGVQLAWVGIRITVWIPKPMRGRR